MPVLLLPRSSGGFVHSLAQWPTCPHLAHLVLAISAFLDHILGRAVLCGLGGGGPDALPRSPLVIASGFLGPEPRPLPPLLDGGRLLKKPRFKALL